MWAGVFVCEAYKGACQARLAPLGGCEMLGFPLPGDYKRHLLLSSCLLVTCPH